MNRTLAFSLTIALILFAAMEGASYLVAKFILPTSVIFQPSYFAEDKAKLEVIYKDYLEFRNPITGWPSKEDEESGRDASGSRINPNFSYNEGADNCISIYGDSYTWSSEVTRKYAWSTVLSELLNCRVGSFGVGGYGSDQAYLRYLNNTDDKAPVVFLNHLSENIMRNVTQFRALTNGYNTTFPPLGFKPRFILDENSLLQLIDLPTFSAKDYPDMLSNPGDYLAHEYFLPGGDTGLVTLGFPYSWTLVKAAGHFHIQAWLADKPWFMDFYEPNHPANGLDITTNTLLLFQKQAVDRGQIPVITVIPTGLDLVYYNKFGVWPYQNLLDRLTENEVDIFNFGNSIIERLGDNDPCMLFDNCNAHYNEQGYRYIAEIAFEELTARGLIPDSTASPAIVTNH
jgi:hypothetical protein